MPKGDGSTSAVIDAIIPLPDAEAKIPACRINRGRSRNGEGIESRNGRGQLRANPSDLVRGIDEERDDVVSSASAISPSQHRDRRSLEQTATLGGGVDDCAFEHGDSGPAVGVPGAVSDGDAIADNGGCVCHADKDEGCKDEGREFFIHDYSWVC